MKGQPVDRVNHHRSVVAQPPLQSVPGKSAQYSGLGRVSMNNVGPQFAQEFLDLKVAHGIVVRIDRPAKPVYDDDLVNLPFRLVEKLALRPKGRPGDESDIVPALGEKLTCNKSILLRPTED